MVRDNETNRRYIIILFLLVLILAVALVANLNGKNNTLSQIGSINIDNGDQKINWDRFIPYDVDLSQNGSITITESGVYHLFGEVLDGSVVVNVGREGQAKLILDSVTINNSTGPAISCEEADDFVIELRGTNKVSDGENYSTSYNSDITGAVYSRGDLTFIGDGKLVITANHEDGIVGKDDVKINSGEYIISAVDDGIRGKDSVYILGGDFHIESGADAIKSTNELTADKGFVLIEGGVFSINSSSAKGIKAINNIIIRGGEFIIDTFDDAIHSNNSIQITGGEIEITSGDDGVHADNKLLIDDGVVNVLKGYEGLEAQVVVINDGKISLFTSDDGINAGGGADASSMNRTGANPFKVDENCEIIINGGEVYVNSAGDGIDSNGYLYFNGGKVIVDGPTNDGNGAIDSSAGVIMNGGEVIAVGASGMALGLGEKSAIYNISVYFDSFKNPHTKIEIKNSAGQLVLEHTPLKRFNHLSAGINKFNLGETYTLYLNGEKYQDFTINSVVTTIGEQNTNRMAPPRH